MQKITYLIIKWKWCNERRTKEDKILLAKIPILYKPKKRVRNKAV